MSEPKKLQSKYLHLVIFVVVLTILLVFIARHLSAFGNALLVMLGFGAVVLVHEFGHFIVAKLSDINVEAFSIFMPPTLLGLKRTEKGIRLRVLPDIFPKEGVKKDDNEENEGAINFTLGNKGKPGETEYRIGLIPFGGFVKMLGQEDVGEVKSSDDPRSYSNKPVHIRTAVLAAGVTCNVVSALIIFMIVFLVGIDLPPAVVGSVVADSPAALAGIKPGDEIIEINGKTKGLEFTDIAVTAALSRKNEEILLKVKHPDDSEEEYEEYKLVAKELPGQELKLRRFGIGQAISLTIANLNEEDANTLSEKYGLQPGDSVVSANGKNVRGYWELARIVNSSYTPRVTLLVQRINNNSETELVEASVRMNLDTTSDSNVVSESDLAHIYSIVPRIRITDTYTVPDKVQESTEQQGFVRKLAAKFTGFFRKIFARKKPEVAEPEHPLKADDVILAIGEIENPTYLELINVVEQYKDKELPVKVLRKDADGIEQTITVTVIPKQPEGDDRVLIGIRPALDAEHPVVARTISTEQGPAKLDIPSGATITAIDGEPVSNFFEIIEEINKYDGQRITIEWRLNEEDAGSVAINVETDKEFITTRLYSADFLNIPFDFLKRSYKADNPIQAIAMGYRSTMGFIAQAYVTLRRLIGGLVSPKNLMGPIGIITTSYQIVAEQPAVYYLYFLGLINAVIAVFNFLPVPPLDGGLVLLLIIEKIKGSAISERVQTTIAYVGWVLILALFLYVTFNDIVRSIVS